MRGLREIRPAGSGGLYLVFGDVIAPEAGRSLMAAARSLRQAALPGIRDVVPGYVSLFVAFDPLAWTPGELGQVIRELDEGEPDATDARPVRIPVLYGGESGPDLEDVARAAGLDPEQAIALHSGREYEVYFIGFTPGFAFMGEVDPRIALGRLAAPRIKVPAGSVGIAGRQTGIYPVPSPGGWRLVGRTPLRLYRPEADDPILLRPGDRVRFEPVAQDEYERLLEREARR